MNKKRYWLKGGIIYVFTGFLIFFVFYLLSTFVDKSILIPIGSKNVFQSSILQNFATFIASVSIFLFGPTWFLVFFDLAMRPPASTSYVVQMFCFGVILQIIYSFIIGSVVGWVYEKIENYVVGN